MRIEELKETLPESMQRYATKAVLNQINDICEDSTKAAEIRKNVLTYSSILNEGKFKMRDYINAVAYVSFTAMGHTYEEAYALTFPERYSRLKKKGTTKKDFSAYVSGYRANKLVKLVAQQAMIPTWLLFGDVYQEAIQVQRGLMLDRSVSDMVRQKAAADIMDKFAPPIEATENAVSTNTVVSKESAVVILQNALSEMASQELKSINQGASTRDIIKKRITPSKDIEDAEFKD